VNPDAANRAEGATGFVDFAASHDDGFIYELLSGEGTVNVYQATSPTSPLPVVQRISTGLPQSGVQGIVYVHPHPPRDGASY